MTPLMRFFIELKISRGLILIYHVSIAEGEKWLKVINEKVLSKGWEP